MTLEFLPYGRQSIDQKDINAVTDSLRSDFLTTGPKVEEFEEAFAAKMGAKYAVVCNSGTAALHLSAIAAGLSKGDKVISPTMSFAASSSAPRLTGAEIVFADCDPSTGLITPKLLLEALERAGDGVKAIVIVHLNGQTCDIEKIGAIANERGIVLIEDACHASGSKYTSSDGVQHKVGACAHSDMACYSLHPVKTITMGEGGVVTTNDKSKYETMCKARSHGMTRNADDFTNHKMALDVNGKINPWYYEIQEIGPNYRATDFACALGLSQLNKLEHFAQRRKTLAAKYDEAFKGFDTRATPFKRLDYCDPVLHLYVLQIKFNELGNNKDRAYIMNELRKKGIGTQVHYIPTHKLPYYENRYGEQSFLGAEKYYDMALSLPLFPEMKDSDTNRVVAAISEIMTAS